jgi:hypothetical protein
VRGGRPQARPTAAPPVLSSCKGAPATRPAHHHRHASIARCAASWGGLPWLIVAACGPKDPGPPPGQDTPAIVEPADDTSGGVDTDHEAPDTEAPDDETPPPDSPDETGAELPLPPLTAPTSWGPGLVDITTAILGPAGIVPDPGQNLPGDLLVPPQAMSAFALDLDGDGAEEVIVSTGGGQVGHVARVRAYVHSGDELVEAPPALTARLGAHLGLLVGALDVDGDGARDLVSNHWLELVNFGRPDGTFEPAWGLDPPDDGPWTRTGNLTLVDLDEDGWLDLVIGARDCRRTFVTALRTGPRAWTFDLTLPAYAVGRTDALTALPTADGVRLFAVASACDLPTPAPGMFEATLTGDDQLQLVPVLADPVLPSWQNDPAFAQRTAFTQIMPMGIAFDDVDHDGQIDLWLSLALSWMAIWQGQGVGPYLDRSFDSGAMLSTPISTVRQVPWGLATPDLDQDGRNDMLVAIGDDDTSFQRLTGAATTDRAWWHGRDWAYVDVSAALGLAVSTSHQGLNLADLDHDGDADPLFGGFGEAPRVYQNQISVGHHGLALRLRGTTSNHLGLGAEVLVEVDGLPARRHLVTFAANPFSLAEPLLFVGTGAESTARRVTLTWPSGTVQVLEDVATGQLLDVEEPAAFSLTPTSRHLRAGGPTPAVLQITPRLPDGTVDPTATVSVVVDGGATAGTPSWQDGAWQVLITPAAVVGSSRVTVLINGVASGVRPRVWWDGP